MFLLPFVLFFRINPLLLEGDTYKSRLQGLLERRLNTEPTIAGGATHADLTTVKGQ